MQSDGTGERSTMAETNEHALEVSEPKNRPFTTSERFLPWQTYHHYLRNYHEHVTMTTPPFKPGPGEMYFLTGTDGAKVEDGHDWRWKSYRCFPENDPTIKCRYWHAKPDGTKLYRRVVSMLREQEGVFLIHYTNTLSKYTERNSDEEEHAGIHVDQKQVCHETVERQSNEMKLTEEAGKMIWKQKEDPAPLPETERNEELVVAVKTDYENDVHKETDNYSPIQVEKEKEMEVRNENENEIRKKAEKEDDLRDIMDILSTCLINDELPTFIRLFQVVPFFLLTLCSKPSSENLNRFHARFDFCYQREFFFQNYHVYTFSYINHDLQNEPAIPFAYGIFSEKSTDAHVEFFRYIKKICGITDGQILIPEEDAEAIQAARIQFDFNVSFSRTDIPIPDEIAAVVYRIKKEEADLYVLILSLFHVDAFINQEVIKGLCGKSKSYLLKENVKHRSVDEFSYPESRIKLESIPNIFLQLDFPLKDQIAVDHEVVKTHTSMAYMLIQQGKVQLIPDEKCFLIRSEKGCYAVSLYPKEICSCQRKKCEHIMAAKLSIGREEKNQENVTLSKLDKRRRGSKKKKETDIIVKETEDLSKANNNDSSKTIFIDTLSGRYRDPTSMQKQGDQPDSSRTLTADPFSIAGDKLLSSTPKNSKANSEPFLEHYDVGDRQVKLFELETLVISGNKKPYDLYIADGVLDVYIFIIYKMIENQLGHLKIFPCRPAAFYKLNCPDFVKQSFLTFWKYDIPSYDIVLCPIVHEGHITLMILIKNLKKVIYLDSLFGISVQHINHVFRIYKTYFEFQSVPFNEEEWEIYAPTDIPKQHNGYDCGVFVALFAETVLFGNMESLNRYYPDSIHDYRSLMRNRILEAIKEKYFSDMPETGTEVDFEGSEYQLSQVATKVPNILRKSPGDLGTMRYLASLRENYWSPDASVCYDKSCQNPESTLVECSSCNHWFHLKCQGSENVSSLPKHYVCISCRQKLNN